MNKTLTPTYADALALLELIREEAGKDNSPMGRSDSLALQRIRTMLDIPMYGFQDIFQDIFPLSR